MNLVMYLKLILVSFVFCAPVCYAQPRDGIIGCGVKGAVLDENGFAILGTNVSFSGKNKVEVAKQKDDGSYEVRLENGVFNIGIREKHNNYKYRRAKIYISCEDETKELLINIYPFGRRVSYGDESPEHRFEVIPFSKLKPNLDVVVAYLKKRSGTKKVTYKSAMITYDKFTIFAESISVDVTSQTVTIPRNGWIEDGTGRRKFDSLTFTIDEKGLTTR